MRVLKDNRFLFLALLAFVSLAPYILTNSFLVWSGVEVAPPLFLLHLSPIYSMLRLGKLLLNIHSGDFEFINRDLAESITIYGFYYLCWGGVLIGFEMMGGLSLIIAGIVIIIAGILAYKKHYFSASIGALFGLVFGIIQLLTEGEVIANELSIENFSFLWGIPVFTLFLTTNYLNYSDEYQQRKHERIYLW